MQSAIRVRAKHQVIFEPISCFNSRHAPIVSYLSSLFNRLHQSRNSSNEFGWPPTRNRTGLKQDFKLRNKRGTGTTGLQPLVQQTGTPQSTTDKNDARAATATATATWRFKDGLEHNQGKLNFRTMDFADETPEEKKLRLGGVVKAAGKVIPALAPYVPALQPVAAVIGAVKK